MISLTECLLLYFRIPIIQSVPPKNLHKLLFSYAPESTACSLEYLRQQQNLRANRVCYVGFENSQWPLIPYTFFFGQNCFGVVVWKRLDAILIQPEHVNCTKHYRREFISGFSNALICDSQHFADSRNSFPSCFTMFTPSQKDLKRQVSLKKRPDL